MNERNNKSNRKMLLKGLSVPVLMFLPLFLAAGRLDYWQGWLYIGINITTLVLTIIVLLDNKDLMKERLDPGEGVKKWDKFYIFFSGILAILCLFVSALDAGRLLWEPKVPVSTVMVGTVLYSIGQLIFLWAKRTNRYFATYVRIQADRGQTVCKQGPYKIVRHPGYVGGLLYEISTPLVLGSYWGIIPAMVWVSLLIVRTHFEDNTLKSELKGYQEYASEVKYRLIPGIW